MPQPDLSCSRSKPPGFYVGTFPLKAIFHRIRQVPDAKSMALSCYTFDLGMARRELHLETATLGKQSQVQLSEDIDAVVVSHLWWKCYIVIFISERALKYLHYRKSITIDGLGWKLFSGLNRLAIRMRQKRK